MPQSAAERELMLSVNGTLPPARAVDRERLQRAVDGLSGVALERPAAELRAAAVAFLSGGAGSEALRVALMRYVGGLVADGREADALGQGRVRGVGTSVAASAAALERAP